MKKILLTIAIAAISASSAFAQENPAQGLRWKGLMNNGFWSNWEISVGAGANYTAWDGLGLTDQEAIGDLGWMVEGGLTKWFNPIVGTRVFLAVGKLNSSDDNGVTGGWIMPHADALVNLSNWIGGYREDRVYYAKVFAGFGASFVNVNNNGSGGFAFNAGLLNSFRVCDALDINLELKGILCAGRDMPRVVSSLAGKYGQIYTATVGITYRFNKRNWDKAYSQEEIDGYLAAIDALESGLADAHRNEGKLAERLAAQKAATDQALKDNEALRNELAKKQDKVISSTAIFFNFDSAKLLDRAKASATCVHRATWRVRPGTVMSDEPGIYFIPALIDKSRSEGLYKGIVNYDRLDAYRDFGGIRIEDDLLVTETGCRIIGDKKIPVTVGELEAVVGR